MTTGRSACRVLILCGFMLPFAAPLAGEVSYSGNTFANGPFWTRPTEDCAADDSPFARDVTYQFQNFTVDTDGAYDIASDQDYDGYLHLFQSPFDPDNPTANCIAANDNFGFLESLIQGVALSAGTEYVVVTSAFEHGRFGSFENSVSGPGEITLGPGGGDPLTFDPAQRQALEELYDATDGDGWLIPPGNWLGPAATECSWFGVRCGDVGGVAGVIELDLSFFGLDGSLPTSFAALADLELLALRGNPNLSGDLANLGPPPLLQTLELGHNAFGGDLGAFLSQLLSQPSLRELLLEDLPAIPPIDFPQDLGQSGLFTLSLEGTNFNAAAFPVSLTEINTLSFLGLFRFDFTEPLPAAVGQFSALRDLTILASTLPGTLPPEIADIPNLSGLGIIGNTGTSGGIPEEIGQASGLFLLDLSQNGLGGEIPATVGDLTGLEFLILSNNGHTGQLPRSLSRLKQLRVLYVDNNPELGGFVPAALVALEQRGELTVQIHNTRLQRAGRFSSLGGLWYDPDLDGSGFNFLALADDLVATFYGYGAGGEPLWLISEPFQAPPVLGQEIGDLVMRHGNDGSGRLDAPQPPATLVEWGRLSLRFDACSRAIATLSGADGEVTMDLRQLATNEDTVCSLVEATPRKDGRVAANLDPRIRQLVDRYLALRALAAAGGDVPAARLVEVLRQLHQARFGVKADSLLDPRID